MSKANQTLKKQLSDLTLSTQKKPQPGKLQEDLGRYIPARFSNIEEKLDNIIEWFDGKIENFEQQYDNKLSLNESELQQSLLESRIERRCIVITVCLSSNLITLGSSDSVTKLQNALISCLRKLRPDDYVCLNIGNASEVLVCDNQKNIQQWRRVLDNYSHMHRILADRESVQAFNDFTQQDQSSKDFLEKQPTLTFASDQKSQDSMR